MNDADASEFEPMSWLLVFHRRCTTPVLNRLVIGEFKHVSAAGWIEAAESWVFYDPSLNRTQILVMPDRTGTVAYSSIAVGNAVLRMPVLARRGSARLGFWCVPAIKHLVGLRSGALRPDALWRDCLANGAEIVSQ